MHRLPFLLCAIALIGSAASAALYFEIGNTKALLEQRLADTDRRAGKLQADLNRTNEENGTLKANLSAVTADLEAVKVKFVQADTRATKLTQDLAETKTVLSVYETTARALSDEVSSLRQDLADARGSNASPEAVAAYKATISDLEHQLAAARNGAVASSAGGMGTAVFVSRVSRATVVGVGPENAFVVLNFGAGRGAHLGQKLNVTQGTQTVATVLISDVRPNFSVAQVLPDTLRGILQKGDSAILLR